MDKEVFRAVYRTLEMANNWRGASDTQIDELLERTRQGLTSDELDDLCNQLIDIRLYAPSEFLSEVTKAVKEKAKTASTGPIAPASANVDCEEFIRFKRAMKELQQAQQDRQPYASGDPFEWRRLWSREITDADRMEAEQAKLDRVIHAAGISIPVGVHG